ncbi:hypothetical protein ACIBI3_05105 [Actinomadura luteofluorescens]
MKRKSKIAASPGPSWTAPGTSWTRTATNRTDPNAHRPRFGTSWT